MECFWTKMMVLLMLFAETDVRDVTSDSILVKRNEKFGSRTVRLYCGFFGWRPVYPPPTPGCPTKIKNAKISTPL